MAFFKNEPNLPVAEAARLEFHLQQIAECIGHERFKLPVQSKAALINDSSGSTESNQTPEQIIRFVGQHLGHDISGLRAITVPIQIEKSGGGG